MLLQLNNMSLLTRICANYTEIVAMGGRLKKKCKMWDYIKSEDVQTGVDYNLISQEITDTESIIRVLRIKEKNILKILKKREDNYK